MTQKRRGKRISASSLYHIQRIGDLFQSSMLLTLKYNKGLQNYFLYLTRPLQIVPIYLLRRAFVIRLNIIKATIIMASIAILLDTSCDNPNSIHTFVTNPRTINATTISRIGLK